MHLTATEFQQLDTQTLIGLIALELPEGLYLDYKQSMSVPLGKGEKREFLKDVTGFANAMGGHLIIGCKEPANGLSQEDQLVGIESGDSLAQDLERLTTTSIDPRIAGLRIVAVPLSDSKSCVVVHVPASSGRPHMVDHAGHRTFYIRNSESTFPMTAHEIRELVLSTASAEQRIKEIFAQQVDEAIEFLGETKPFLLVQAAPLVRPTAMWDVLGSDLAEVIKGGKRRSKIQHNFSLASNIAPRPTLYGVRGADNRANPTWETNVYRDGCVSALVIEMQIGTIDGEDVPILHSGYCDLFRAFAMFLNECWEVTDCDLPYAITALHRNSSRTRLSVQNEYFRNESHYGRRNLQWPIHMRESGSDVTSITEDLSREMFNAFGVRDIVD